MKKFLCAVLMICLLISSAAMAESVNSLSWETFVPVLEAAELNGEFHTFNEVSVKMWLPEGLNPVELSEEDKANGIIAYFMPDDKTAAVSVVYTNVNGMSTEEYAEAVKGIEGTTEVEIVTVNGFPCVTYKMPEKDAVCAPASSPNPVMCWRSPASPRLLNMPMCSGVRSFAPFRTLNNRI